MLSYYKFRTRFAHCCRYTPSVKDPWPKETILFYRLIGEGTPTSWKMISSSSKIPGHVESRMIQDVQLEPACLPGATYTLYMVISYSPCRRCSDELIDFKSRFKLLQKKLSITIKIGSFYRIFNPLFTYNIDGLLNLVRQNIVLKTFDGDSDWLEFLHDIINLPDEHLGQWLAVTGKPERRAREYIDRCILIDIYGCCHGVVAKQDLCKMAGVASPMQVPQIYKIRNNQSFVLQLGHHWHYHRLPTVL